MSTLMSTDMITNRPTTKLHAPPGGATSISLGDAWSTTPKPPPSPVPESKVAPKVAAPVSTAALNIETKTISATKTVTVAIGGSAGSEIIRSSLSKSLQSHEGLKVNFVEVANQLILPYFVRKIINETTSDAIIAVAINIGVRNDTLSIALLPALIELGISSGIPIIPGVVQFDSPLEAKALLPSYADTWSTSVSSLFAPLSIVEAAPVKAPSSPTKAASSNGVVESTTTLNDRRNQLVLQAFQLIDTDKSGILTVEDIVSRYDGSKHPDVIAGKRTSEDVLKEFLRTFDVDQNGQVTPSEFVRYYEGVSKLIDNDDYFELMMRNAWHISGGEGWCANTTCKRVLVTHADGRQTVEEIKNDLSLNIKDANVLKANLAEQGITDIVNIEMKAGVIAETTPATGTNPLTSPPTPSKPAAGQRIIASNITDTKSSGSRQAPGGKSSLVLG